MATHAEREQRRLEMLAAIGSKPIAERLAECDRQAAKHNLNLAYVRKLAKESGLLNQRVRGVVVERTKQSETRERNAAIVKEVEKTPLAERREKVRSLAEEHGVQASYIATICRDTGVRFGALKPNKIKWAFGIVGDYNKTGDKVELIAKRHRTTADRVKEILKIAKNEGVV